MKILYLHGLHSVPGGVKPTYLKDHGYEVINPKLDDDDFASAVSTAQANFEQHQPEVVVGSSRGGAVAMNISRGDAQLVLLCPAWKNWGIVKTVGPDTVILHSRADEIVPFADSEELVENSGLPITDLIEVGDDHRLEDPETLAKMLSVVDSRGTKQDRMSLRGSPLPTTSQIIVPITPDQEHIFTSTVSKQIIPWIERSTIPFFHLRKDAKTNEYTIIDKDRSGVLLKIGDGYFVLTASHNIPEMIADQIYLCMAWDEETHTPILITSDQIAVSNEATLDVAAIKLKEETATRLIRRHTPIVLADIAANCRQSDGMFLIVGYPRAGTTFVEQKWNDPYPHEIQTESLKFICNRLLDGWKHDKLKYSPNLHIVVRMTQKAISSTTDLTEELPDHSGIQGISGCGIWFIANRGRYVPISTFGVSDCKLVAIEHSYDETAGRVAGTWIDLALRFLLANFPEANSAMKIVYPQSSLIWTPYRKKR